MTFLIHTTKARVPARANWGRWVADCPRCPSALQMAPQDPFFKCLDCGAPAEVVWPPEEIRLSIERLLLMRPRVEWQSWEPGETLTDLMKENALLGVFDPLKLLEFDPGQSLLSVDNEGIAADMLPITNRPEFKALER